MLRTIVQPRPIEQLKSQITQLKHDKEQLRIFLHEIIEAYYRAINQTESKENFCQKCGCQEVSRE